MANAFVGNDRFTTNQNTINFVTCGATTSNISQNSSLQDTMASSSGSIPTRNRMSNLIGDSSQTTNNETIHFINSKAVPSNILNDAELQEKMMASLSAPNKTTSVFSENELPRNVHTIMSNTLYNPGLLDTTTVPNVPENNPVSLNGDKLRESTSSEPVNPVISEAVSNILHSSDLTSLSALVKQKNKKKNEERVRRPMNAFMLYAQVARRKVATKYPNLNYAKLSKTLGKIWQVLPEEERRPFLEEAKRLRTQHKIKHPDYKYSPKRSKEKKTQNGTTPKRSYYEGGGQLFNTLKQSPTTRGPMNHNSLPNNERMSFLECCKDRTYYNNVKPDQFYNNINVKENPLRTSTTEELHNQNCFLNYEKLPFGSEMGLESFNNGEPSGTSSGVILTKTPVALDLPELSNYGVNWKSVPGTTMFDLHWPLPQQLPLPPITFNNVLENNNNLTNSSLFPLQKQYTTSALSTETQLPPLFNKESRLLGNPTTTSVVTGLQEFGNVTGMRPKILEQDHFGNLFQMNTPNYQSFMNI